MRARFQLRTLGEPALATMGGRPVKLRTKKQVALLCYLAVARRWHTRDALAELLWPDGDFAKSRHSLAVALSYLRGKLGRDILETVQERVRLHPDGIELDVDRLLRGDVLGSDTDMPLDVDGFLEGFEVPNALPFAHWRDGERARLLPNVLDALVILIDRCRRTGDFRQIETLGLRLQRFEPLSEHAMRARMEARAFAGDRLTALRLFEQWKAALDEQLQAAPSDLLEGMALRLRRRGWERPGSADIPTVHTDQWKDRPFVGRTREYRELYEAWEAAQRCEASHRLVLGDSGIGKSTLVERVTTAAGLEGATVARVQCHEAEREIPYAAVSGLIAQLVERPGASATPPEALAELAQTIPVVRQRFPVLPPPIESQGDAARILFTEASHALIAAVAEEHPVILVVDDVHHADDVSLAVLHRVVRLADKQAVLLFFLARLGELNQSPQAARLRDHGASLNIHQLTLSTLSREESGELLDGLLKDLELTASPTVRRTLLGAAAGYPLVLELLVRDWARSGDRSLAMALDAVTAEVDTPSEPEEAYRLLVQRLVSDLDPITRNVLNVAAVLGRRLNEAALYSIADLKVGEVMTGLAHLTQVRILRDASSRLEFTNDLVRAQAYLTVPSPVRHLLHDRIATALIARITDTDSEIHLEIAWHCMRSGRTGEGTQHLLSGARDAAQLGAVCEAERRLASGITAMTGAERTEATLLLAELLQEQSRWAESVATLMTDAAAIDSCAGRAMLLLATSHTEPIAEPTITRHAADTLYLLSAVSDARSARPAFNMCARLASLGRDAAVTTSLLVALQDARARMRDVDANDEVDWRICQAFMRYYTRTSSHSDEELLRELADLATVSHAIERPSRRSFRIVSGLGFCSARMANYGDALAWHVHALDLASRLEDPRLIANANLALSHTYFHCGSWSEQYDAAARCNRAVDLSNCEPYVVVSSYLMALASHVRGDQDGYERGLKRLEASVPDGAPGWLTQMGLLYRADLEEFAGRTRLALQLAKRGFQVDAGLSPERENESALARWVVRIVVTQGSWPEGEQFLARSLASTPLLSQWDEAERSAALVTWLAHRGWTDIALQDRLRMTLRNLPAAASDWLTRFGLSLA